MKIIVMSDSYGNLRPLRLVREAYPDADLFIHLGNSGLSPKEMSGFVTVAGNIEKDDEDYPVYIVQQMEGHKAFLVHGHTFFHSYDPDYNAVAGVAAKMGCDICLFGHTQQYYDSYVNGIRMLNPGSVLKNRDNTPPSYMVLTVSGEDIIAERKDYGELARREPVIQAEISE